MKHIMLVMAFMLCTTFTFAGDKKAHHNVKGTTCVCDCCGCDDCKCNSCSKDHCTCSKCSDNKSRCKPVLGASGNTKSCFAKHNKA